MELDKSYLEFIEEIKKDFKQTQLKTISKVNSELILFYFNVGKKLHEKQKEAKWGDKVLELISNEFITEGLKGFSTTNLKFMRKFYQIYSKDKIGQQLANQIPWYHNILIINKINSIEEKHWYIQKTIENGWSRTVLQYQIETNLYDRSSKELINNFSNHLPKEQSDLAKEIFKDKYILNFIDREDIISERDLENKLILNIKTFLLELGNSFSFIGNQYRLEVDNEEYFIDLLFFNRDLNCLIAIELKTGKFKPEYAGKMNFYLNLLKKTIKKKHENNPIGIILCKEKHKVIAELALEGVKTPIAISEFTHSLEIELNKNLKKLELEENIK